MDSSTSLSDVLLTLILSEAYTRTEAVRLHALLRTHLESVYFKTDGNSSTSQNAQSTDHPFLTRLTNQIENVQSSHIYPALTTVENAIESTCPNLTLYTPIDIDTSDIQRLGKWARKEVHEHVLLTFIIDPSYIGGCGIGWRGKLQDYGYSYISQKQADTIRHLLQPSDNEK